MHNRIFNHHVQFIFALIFKKFWELSVPEQKYNCKSNVKLESTLKFFFSHELMGNRPGYIEQFWSKKSSSLLLIFFSVALIYQPGYASDCVASNENLLTTTKVSAISNYCNDKKSTLASSEPSDSLKQSGTLNIAHSDESSKKKTFLYPANEIMVKFAPSATAKLNPGKPLKTGIPSINRLNKFHSVLRVEQVARPGKHSNRSHNLFRWYKIVFKGPSELLEKRQTKFNQHKNQTPNVNSNPTLEYQFNNRLSDYFDDPNIEASEPNYLIISNLVPNDPYYQTTGTWDQSYSDHWGLKIINAETAWNKTTGSETIVVADIDTGVDRNHIDIAANVWTNTGEIPNNNIDDDGNGYVDDYYGWDWVNNDNDPMDDHGHGTHTAGTIAATGNNSEGVVGVAWQAKIMALKFLSSSGSGNTDNGIRALQYAADMNAHIASNSWGGPSHPAVDDAVAYAHQKGVVVVAAAGNSNTDAMTFSPASAPGAITVAASDFNDLKASFSNFGDKIDVAAPGVQILSTRAAVNPMCDSSRTVGGDYCHVSGTSMATPHVAGLAALLLAQNPNLSNEEIRQIIRTTSDDLGNPGRDQDFGYGRINAGAALEHNGQVLAPFITSPRSGDSLTTEVVNIVGHVDGNLMVSYKVEIRADNLPDNPWISLATSIIQPETDQILATLKPADLNEGFYSIRLSAVDKNGTYYHYSVLNLEVDNFELNIASPIALVPKSQVSIIGTAKVKNPAVGFDHYLLEWSPGSSETIWTVISNAVQAAENDNLGIWDTTALSHLGDYLLRLTVTGSNGYSAQITKRFKIDQDIVAGWPQIVGFDINPSIVDLDGDGNKEIIVAGRNSNAVYVYKKNGSQLPGFPVIPSPDGGNFSGSGNTTIADVDKDGTQEILVNANQRDEQGNLRSSLSIIKANGTLYPGWTAPIFRHSPLIPLVADVNGDGTMEIVTIEIARWALGYSDYIVHAFDLQGTEVSGFPRAHQIPDISGASPYLSVHDLDGDNAPEFALVQNDQLILFDHEGNIVTGWPQQVPTRENGDLVWFEGVLTSGDVDGDGQKELVASSAKNCQKITESYYICFIGNYSTLYVWDKHGSVLPGYPRTTDSDGFLSWDGTAVPLIDLDGDGIEEIIPGTDPFFIFDGAGSTVTTSSMRVLGPLSVADVNGDSVFEFASGKQKIKLFNESGTVLWERHLGEDYNKSSVLLSDLDGDGVMELIKTIPGVNPVTNRVDSSYYHLYVWQVDLGGIAGHEWPMYAQNHLRTGGVTTENDNSEDNIAPVVSITSPIEGSTLSAESTFIITVNANDVGSGVDKVAFMIDDTVVCIVLTAPYNCVTEVSEGPHTLSVRATDLANNSTTDSITVTGSIPDTTAPTMVITAPNDGSTLSGEGPFTITVYANDADSGIDHVAFQIDNTVVCVVETAPYSCVIAISEGIHTLTATAIDLAENSARDSINVTRIVSDTTLPTVSITSPVNGATLASKNGSVTIEASASDSDSGVNRVEFWVDNKLICTDQVTPYLCITKVSKGDHTLTVSAFDNAGNSANNSVIVNRRNGNIH